MGRPRRFMLLVPAAAACLLLLAASCGKRQAPPTGGPMRLAFRRNLLTFDLPAGEQTTRDVRVAGVAAGRATLAITAVEGPATAELLPPAPGETAGVRLTFVAKQAGVGEGRVTVSTGLAPPTAPKQLVLYYSWKVGSRDAGP